MLLRHDEYRRLSGEGRTIRDLLDLPATEDIEFDPPRLGGGTFRAAELG